MKKALAICMVFFAWSAGFALDEETSDLLVRRSISCVESADNPMKVGRYGELGVYQFRRMTWRDRTKLPFAYARNPEHAERVAILHQAWIKRELRRAGLDATPWLVAAVWNAGLEQVLYDGVPAVTVDYANRVVNIYEALAGEKRGRPSPVVFVLATARP